MKFNSYGIRNIETGQYLSKIKLFTYDDKPFLSTTKDHAHWLKERFDKEDNYRVEVVNLG